MNQKDSYRSRVYSLMNELHGIVTPSMAASVGVPGVELRKLLQRGALERVARGVYRIPFAATNSFSDAAEAVEICGDGSFLLGESVLAMLEIGNFNPRKIFVGGTHRLRKNLPSFVSYIQISDAPGEITTYRGVPAQSVSECIRALAGSVAATELAEMIREATRFGYLDRGESEELQVHFGLVEQMAA